MIKKFISSVTSVIIAAVISASPMSNADAFDVYEDPVQKNIFLSNGNYFEFFFLD